MRTADANYHRLGNLLRFVLLLGLILTLVAVRADVQAAELRAGAAKIDITNREAGPVNDTLNAKALVLDDGSGPVVLITVDAVAIGEIGPIGNSYLPDVRKQLKAELGISPERVVVNASHCHGIVCADVAARTVEVVKQAAKRLEKVKVGAGTGFENRISENRRLKLKDGTEADVRHAYSMPRDEDVAEIGPVDPQIGLLRIDRLDGRPLAVVYNFACHPIIGTPSKGNTADFPGFASRVIEENWGTDTIALFVQGCAGDINPVTYKDVNSPRDAEPLGNLLGLSVLRGLRKIEAKSDSQLKLVNLIVAIPRGRDLQKRIEANEAEVARLVKSIGGTSLNFKTFLELQLKYNLSPEFPSYYSHRYALDKRLGRNDLSKLDEENRANVKQYLANIDAMERISRLQVNAALLRRHLAQHEAAGNKDMELELVGLRVGDFRLVTFPAELTVEIGLNIKEKAKLENAFVAGYTNGYIYYAPTAKQRNNPGYAQEDCDSLVGPDWQEKFESKAVEVLKGL